MDGSHARRDESIKQEKAYELGPLWKGSKVINCKLIYKVRLDSYRVVSKHNA